MCVCVYKHDQLKVFVHPQNFLFFILKVLVLMKNLTTTIDLFIILDTSIPEPH